MFIKNVKSIFYKLLQMPVRVRVILKLILVVVFGS